MHTLNVAGRSYTGLLLQPLSYARTAPIPFLWAERLAVQLNGVDQAAPRVLPFVAACLTLILLWAAANHFLMRSVTTSPSSPGSRYRGGMLWW